jgi:hypothetical protein
LLEQRAYETSSKQSASLFIPTTVCSLLLIFFMNF